MTIKVSPDTPMRVRCNVCGRRALGGRVLIREAWPVYSAPFWTDLCFRCQDDCLSGRLFLDGYREVVMQDPPDAEDT